MDMMLERPDTRRKDSVDSYEDREERIPQQIHFNTKKEEREREKGLQKKLGELTTQIQRLERRIALLRAENDSLRKKQDDHRPLEEKIKTLKKRNSELASIARRLEEKAKTLQQENSRVRSRSVGPEDQNGEVDHVKRLYARQRAKELAEHAKIVLGKEEEIDDLRTKCQQLADQLGNGELLHPQNAPQFEEKDELVNIIKQAAKERLQLEQQLAHVKKREKADGSEDPAVINEATETLVANEQQRKELQEANEILHSEIEKLEKALQKAEQLESTISEKTEECSELTEKLKEAQGHSHRLEKDLKAANIHNSQLSSEIKVLQGKAKDADKISEECSTLKAGLSVAQKEREAAQEEVAHLNKRVHSLENLVRDLQESAEAAGRLEHEKKAALQQLQDTKAQINNLQRSLSQEESTHKEEVKNLNKRVVELEEKSLREEERREDLSKEVDRLKKESEEKQLALEAAEQLGREAYQRERERTASIAKATLEPEIVSDNARTMEPKPAVRTSHSDAPNGGGSFLSSWAQNGPIQVYIAKYNYDPFEYSPNENPEAELPLSAGDYVLVVGEMDEDGFFDGELIDGRQGLVPSNFIEKVEDEDLAEFHTALMEAGHKDYSNHSNNSSATTIGHNRTAASSEDSMVMDRNSACNTTPTNTNNNNNNNNDNSVMNNNNLVAMEMSHGDDRDKLDIRNGVMDVESDSDLEDIQEMDEETASLNSHSMGNGTSTSHKLPPCPRGLSLDRQLSNGLVVSWKEPESIQGLEVQAYHVLLDGQLKTSVKADEKTKAMVECEEPAKIHRVCVQCLSNRGQSKDAQCTMLVGNDVYPKPSDLKISHQSPTSATLSWLPGSTNYQHSIQLNGIEVRTVKPGTFRCTLTGLTPGSAHQVTLIAKSISGTLNEEKSKKWMENVSASIKFFTPEAGCPEAPLDVQVEAGTQSGTLLISWLPVTINTSGLSNGTLVSGYYILSDNRKIKTVSGATADHATINFAEFQGRTPGHLAVRTFSSSGAESSSSDAVYVPTELAKQMAGEAVSSGKEISSIKPTKNGKPKVKQESPRPSPRKGINQKTSPQEFHSQKPSAADHLTAPKRVVPAIEITRDSGSERGASLDEETDRDSSSSRHNNNSKTQSPEATVVGSHPRNRSAFRQVDQNRDNLSGKDIINSSEEPTTSYSSTTNTNRFPDNGEPPSPSNHQNNPNNKPTGSPNYSKDGSRSSKNNKSIDQITKDSSNGKDSTTGPSGSSPQTSSMEDAGGDTDSISGEINSVVDENTVRLFIALFDYDPHTMSPNVDCIDDELPFREGQILKVYGDKDPDGFYKGECHGRVGFVPCNMVSEVQIDDPELVDQLLQESLDMTHKDGKESIDPTPKDSSTPNGIAAVPNEKAVRKMIALYDYDPQELSPNVDAELELSFKTGDVIYIFGDMDEDGFYNGDLSGRRGLVPSNFLQPAPTSDEEGIETDSVASATRSRTQD